MIPLNRTPFEIGWLVGKVRPPASSLTVIVKGTYRLDEGGTAALAEEQSPLRADVEVDGLLRYPSDFAHFKPNADVIVVGHAYGRGASDVRAGVQVGALSKTIRVVGDDGRPFDKIELSYRNAYGGPKFARNPIGKERPNLRDPRRPEDEPVSFGPIPIHWPQRAAKLGTFDAKWKKDRWPWLPEDADPSFANAAPEDQQLREYLTGDELVRLENLHPQHSSFEFRLPGVRVHAFYVRSVGSGFRHQEIGMRLDTLFVNMEAGTLVLVWRGLIPLPHPDLEETDFVLVDSEILKETPKPASYYQAVFAEETAPPPEERTEEPAPTVEEEAEPPPLSREECLARLGRGEGFRGMDLAGVDLSESDLSGVDFREAILAEADLSMATCAGANFTEAVLAGADLSGSSLPKAVLIQADLTEAVLSSADLRGADLSRARASGAILVDADLSEAVAQGADFSGADLSDAVLRRTGLREADLSSTRLHGTDLSEADLTEASIEGAWGSRIRAAGAILTELKASEANLLSPLFRGVKGVQSTWIGAQLFAADFQEADLSGAMFDGAHLANATFSLAILKQARFIGCGLRETGFLRANLFCANFEKADLTGADLSGSNLFCAGFLEATTDRVRLDGANVKRTLPAERT